MPCHYHDLFATQETKSEGLVFNKIARLSARTDRCGSRGAGAATLAADPAGGSPAGGYCPVATVVIPGDGEGDQPVESPEIKSLL